MAQLLFESVPVVSKVSAADTTENSTVLTVHRMIDPQLIVQYEAAPVVDESDVFQCGRCKKQFTSIDIFVNHKTECNNNFNQVSDITLPTNVCGIPQNAVVRKIQLPSSLANYQQSVILTEADILQLSTAGLDSNVSSGTTANSSIQISPTHTVLQQPPVDGQCVPTHIQQVLHHMTTTNETQHSQAVELSILNDKLISRPLILTSQQHGSAMQSLVLNIGNATQPQTIICSNSETDKNSPALVESIPEPTGNFITNEQEACENEPSTVNIITEFHSSMVKTKKESTEAEVVDNQLKKDNKLNCAYCSKSFTKNFDLQQHIRSHTGEKPFQCIVCGRAFAQKSNVKKHMQTHKVWPDGLARTLPPLSLSLKSAADDAAQDSNSLDASIDPNGNASDKPKSGEIDKSLYACSYCDYIGKSYHKLKSHMKLHDAEKVYKCILTSCGLMFTDLDTFLEHTRSHENEMTYRCHQCNTSFASLYDLGSHQLTHAVGSTVKSKCTKRFFQCNLCLNKYSTPAALNHHLATSSHTYSCSLCNKVFPCERYLRRHLLIHSEAESHTCKLCGKGFRTEGYLKVHMLVHSEEKPYECTTCKAAFNRKDKLKRHLLIHEPVKRYKCPFRTRGCPKEFNRPDKLKAHILTHSCIKPYSCKVCGKTFTRKAYLHDHIRQNHEDAEQIDDDGKQLDKNDLGKSFSDYDNEKFHKTRRIIRRKKVLDGSHRSFRTRKKVPNTNRNAENVTKRAKNKVRDLLKLNGISDNSEEDNPKRREKIKDLLKFNDIGDNSTDPDVDSVSDLADDIPTAHIEIIPAHGTLVTGSDLTHISLGSDMTYGDLQFDSNVQIETDVPTGSPITVEVIHSSNSNSLLTGELHSTADISDFS